MKSLNFRWVGLLWQRWLSFHRMELAPRYPEGTEGIASGLSTCSSFKTNQNQRYNHHHHHHQPLWTNTFTYWNKGRNSNFYRFSLFEARLQLPGILWSHLPSLGPSDFSEGSANTDTWDPKPRVFGVNCVACNRGIKFEYRSLTWRSVPFYIHNSLILHAGYLASLTQKTLVSYV